MSLRDPQRNRALPHAIQGLLNEMFARDTGFSGPEIIDFFSRYDLNVESYPWGGGAPSRWQIFEDCLTRFDAEAQRRIIGDLLEYDGPMKYGPPLAAMTEKVRTWLGAAPTPMARPPLDKTVITWAAVNDAWKKAADRVSTDPAAAITSARTLLETVCLHILEARGAPDSSAGDLQKLYRTTARALAIAPDQQTEEVFKQVMGACAGIAVGLSAMRNRLSDAHGRPSSHRTAEARHARLAVHAASTLALFLLEAHLAAVDSQAQFYPELPEARRRHSSALSHQVQAQARWAGTKHFART